MSLCQQICSESFFFCLLQCWAWWRFQYPFLFLNFIFYNRNVVCFSGFHARRSFHQRLFIRRFFRNSFLWLLEGWAWWRFIILLSIIFKFNFCITEMWFLSQVSMLQYWRSSFTRLRVDQHRQPNAYFSISILKYPWPLVSIKNW